MWEDKVDIDHQEYNNIAFFVHVEVLCEFFQ